MAFNPSFFQPQAAPAKKGAGFDASAFKGIGTTGKENAPSKIRKIKDPFTGKSLKWHESAIGSGVQFDVVGKGGVNYPAFNSGYGASFKVDQFSGRPLLSQVNPDRRTTTLLPDRVAQTFDVTKPQRLERFTTERLPLEASQAIRKAVGATAYQQLDHTMPLQLGGSNEGLNLRPVDLVDGKQPLVGLENQLYFRAARGEISVVDAWKEMARAKNIPLADKPILEAPQPANFSEITDRAFPDTKHVLSELQIDPLSLKKDPTQALKVYIETMGESATHASEAIARVFKRGETPSGRIGAAFSGLARTFGAAISPVTALFTAAEEIPVVGTAAKLIAVPFAFLGDAGKDAAWFVGETLLAGIKDEDRRNIVEGMGEVFALAAQIVVGGKAGTKLKEQKIRLEKKFGKKDANTIIKKAEEIAAEGLSAEGGKVLGVPTTVEAPRKFELPPLKEVVIQEPVVVPQVPLAEVKVPELSKSKINAKTELQKGDIVSDPNLGRFIVTDRVRLKPGTTNEVNYLLKDVDGDIITQSAKDLRGFTLVRKVGEKVLEPTQGVRTPRQRGLGQEISEKPIEAPVKQEVAVPKEVVVEAAPGGPKASKIAKSIEAKAIEQKLTKGFSEVAGYDPITIKDQAVRATELINKDIELARRIVKGEEMLPDNLKGTSLITAMEQYIKDNPSAELAYELANSRLVSATSIAAQELRLAAERVQDSATVRLQEVRRAREVAAEKQSRTTKSKTTKQLKESTEKVNLKKEELSWDRFLEGIKC